VRERWCICSAGLTVYSAPIALVLGFRVAGLFSRGRPGPSLGVGRLGAGASGASVPLSCVAVPGALVALLLLGVLR